MENGVNFALFSENATAVDLPSKPTTSGTARWMSPPDNFTAIGYIDRMSRYTAIALMAQNFCRTRMQRRSPGRLTGRANFLAIRWVPAMTPT